MYKHWFLIIQFISISVLAQADYKNFTKKLNTIKTQNNLAEFVYVHLDEFAKNPTLNNLSIFESLPVKLWRSPANEKETTSLIYYYINYGYYLKEFGKLNEAIISYEKGFQLYKNNEVKNYDIIEFCLKPLANCYTRIGEIERAEDVLKVTIEKAQQNKNESQIVATYLNLSALLRTKGDVNSAISYLNLGLKLTVKGAYKARLYSDLGINYLSIDDLAFARKQLDLSNKFNNGKDVGVLMRNNISFGLIHLKSNNLIDAEKAFSDALESSKQLYGNNHREVAKVYVQLAEVYRQKQDFKKAQQLFQKGLQTLISNFNPKTLNENPKESSLFSENTLKDIFDGRAATYIEANNIEEALKNFELSFVVEEELRSSFLTQNSKILLQQENRRRSEKCIDICYLQYQKTKDIIWLEKSFEFAEQTKNSVVVEAKNLLKEKLKIGENELFLHEDNLAFEKAQLTKEIELEQLKGENADISKLVILTNKRDVVSTELQLLKAEIFKAYPQLNKKIDYKVVKAGIEDKLLSPDDSFIEFFDGVSNIYRFIIKKDEPISVIRIEKTIGFMDELESFLSFFSDARGVKIQNNIKEYGNKAFKLHTTLFGSNTAKNIILVPDGLLAFVPYDALLTEKTTITNFEKLPYLIKKSKISYAYFGTILLQEVNRKKFDKEFVGFFPVFENNQRNLSELTFTKEEAISIEKHLNGNFLLKKDALKKTFVQEVNNYSIVHLSTHASAGTYYDPPAIEFYDETLYLSEIYGYNLQTNLMVLSACETGIGTVRKGEGAMSLARGFSYAGVQNLVVSLWKVNDKSTENLMSNFYEEFSKEKNNSGALYQSKLNYLNDSKISSAKKSPYYWASFIYIGQPDVTKNITINYWWFLTGIALLIAIFVTVKNLKFKRKK